MVADLRMRDPALLEELYRRMCRISLADAGIVSALKRGEFRFTYWEVAGQETISAGACLAVRQDDEMLTTYRGLGDSIAKGVPLVPLLAEWAGLEGGLSGGRTGPMGISAPEVGLVNSTGIVGGGPPIADGLALAAKVRGTDRVVVVTFGDGATSIGTVHEAMNLAAL
jgi:2-oxoisovalerate dehydrogenase E1 component